MDCPLGYCKIREGTHAFCAVMYARDRLIYKSHINEPWFEDFVLEYQSFRRAHPVVTETHGKHKFGFFRKKTNENTLYLFDN